MKQYIGYMSLFLSFFSCLTATNVMQKARDLGHDKFYAAVEKAGIMPHATKAIGAANSMAPFTVFVPNNTAMAHVEQLQKEEIKDRIKFHVVPGQNFDTKDKLPSDMPTVGGALAKYDGTHVFMEESEIKAKIIGEPHKADNGTLYVIDTVLEPGEE